jgi:hypothetical protein
MRAVAMTLSMLLLIVAVISSAVLMSRALRVPAASMPDDTLESSAPRVRLRPGALRLFSRLLFARRSTDAITLDCTLVAVDGELPPGVEPPAGLPFTLRLRCPDTTWLASRVEELLIEWADESRELVLELAPENGKVRTTIMSDGSSVHLELAGAAGLGSDLPS